MSKKTIVCVVGARPNFMKIAPIIKELSKFQDQVSSYLVHTGQHYDQAMKAAFFQQLGIPEPDIDLEVGSGSHCEQTANIMLRFEPVLDKVKPCAVLVVGDVNSTIACSLVAVKKRIPVIHVEAGLRSRDREMPEEINRVLTDQISDSLFITERSAQENLMDEGIDISRIHFAGNVMIDTLLDNLKLAIPFAETLKDYEKAHNIPKEGYGLLTMHRPSNVDDPQVLQSLLESIVAISEKLPIIFPIHPRTRSRIEQEDLLDLISSGDIICLPPVGYLQMLGLMKSAKMVLTDSGGLQEETTSLGIPCVTLRENTERPITIEEGTNTIVGTDREKIKACVDDILATGGKSGRIPEYWDGKAAGRIVAEIKKIYL
ncbi:MAG: UDP-N-acetylglucosamine 2-epimerase (non-hydrolyzing) [Methylobacter sp.]|nr:UDP-N-acetylglucosamine 2-epimerase (non-hydrolyzing) [Methylobacter sp.]